MEFGLIIAFIFTIIFPPLDLEISHNIVLKLLLPATYFGCASHLHLFLSFPIPGLVILIRNDIYSVYLMFVKTTNGRGYTNYAWLAYTHVPFLVITWCILSRMNFFCTYMQLNKIYVNKQKPSTMYMVAWVDINLSECEWGMK